MFLPKVSVIIPVFNTGKYVERCINSVLSQTYNSIEIIIVDDGSTDNSAEIVDEIAINTCNVVVIHQKNKGLSGARRAGLVKVTGEYVMFLDSDDTLPDNAIEIMVSISLKENLDAFYGTYMRIINGNEYPMPSRDYEGVLSGDQMLLKILDPQFIFIGCMCFSKREFWDEDMFCWQRELPSEDLITNVKLAIKCNRIGVYNKSVYNYYLVDTSLSITGKYYDIYHFKVLYNQLKDVLTQNDKQSLTKDQVRVKEIEAFGFYIKDIDTKDEWYKQVLSYDVSQYPLKIKTLHILLHVPWLLRLLVRGNRIFKRIILKKVF